MNHIVSWLVNTFANDYTERHGPMLCLDILGWVIVITLPTRYDL